MGIKSLSKYLNEKYPDVFELIHISEYHFKKVAIDTSLYMCNYKALYGEDGWIGAFVKLVACLRSNEIHPVFIYDSGCPPEKLEERKIRADNRAKTLEKIQNLENAIDNYLNNGEIEDILLEFQEKRKISPPKLLRQKLNIKVIQYYVEKMRKQAFTISREDFALTRKLFNILQVPYLYADMEAETLCSDLCIQGKVDAVLSEDTDVLAYGAPVFLTKINTANSTCYRINYNKLLEYTGLDHNQFLDFCIMCGTDYNKNIYKVGPAKSLSLISQHGTIENIRDSTSLDISVLNHVRVRELFRDYKKTNKPVYYCGTPDFAELEKLMVEKNAKVDMEYIKKSFLKNTVIFEDD